MGTLRLTPAQWTTLQALADRPAVERIYRRVNLGIPAGVDATGAGSDTPAFYLFDDPRLGGNWRVRVAAGPTLFFQEWDQPFGGSQLRELSFSEMRDEFQSA